MAIALAAMAAPAYSGTDIVHVSGFEALEQCGVYDGIGDTIEIESIQLSGTLTLDGGPFPVSPFHRGRVSLRDRRTGDVIALGLTNDQSYTANIVPGSYDVLYDHVDGELVPANLGATLAGDIVLSESGTLDIDVPSAVISGRYRVGGSAPPASPYDSGEIRLISEAQGEVLLGETRDAAFSEVMVLPGDYEIRYTLVDHITVPVNTWGLVGALLIDSNAEGIVIDVPVVTLEGVFTHNGEAFPAVDIADGNFFLTTDDGDQVLLGNSRFSSYADIQLIPGDYDTKWVLESAHPTVPVNTSAILAEDLAINGGTLDIDIESWSVDFAVTLGGQTPPVSPYQTGLLRLRVPSTGVQTLIGHTHDQMFTHQVIAGNYEVIYSHEDGDNMPQNQAARILDNLTIADASPVPIDIPFGFAAGSAYHNGELFPATPYQAGEILLRNGTDELLVGNTSDQFIQAMAVQGEYDVYYRHVVGNDVPQNSMARVMTGWTVTQPPVRGGAGGFQVESIAFSGLYQLNGQPPPASPFHSGEIALRWELDSVPLDETFNGTYDSRVVLSPYWVHYDHFDGTDVPVNDDAIVDCARLERPIL